MTLKNTGLFWRQHKTQNTTHTDTTTNKMSHATLPSSGFAPSFSMGRAVAPPNHGAAMRRPRAVRVALAVVGLLAWGGKIRGIEQ